MRWFAYVALSASLAAGPEPSAEELLLKEHISMPLPKYPRAQLQDTFHQSRQGTHPHEAIDLPATRGTPVLAVDDGKIARLFHSKPGGLTIYQFDKDEVFAYYYAHLDRYAPGLYEGATVKRGDLLAYVGSTGNASPDAPHLHFAVFKLLPGKKWWQGIAINPFRALQAAYKSN